LTAATGITKQSVDNALKDWPAESKKAAVKVIEKYGLPNEMTASLLVWHDTAPFKRTVLYRKEVTHDFPKPHKDVLEQFVDYRVPPDKFDELAQYDGSVVATRTNGELSARCDKVEMNFLALNLAHDIVTGKRTVEEARDFYSTTAMKAMAGAKPEYTQKLNFDPKQPQSADADKPTIGEAMREAVTGGDSNIKPGKSGAR